MSFFDIPQNTINWAEKSVSRAEDIYATYLRSKPFKSIVEVDQLRGRKQVKLKLISPPPTDVTGFLTDALVNTKHSFDQSIYAAACTMGANTSFKGKYPWAKDKTTFEGIIKKRQSNRDSSLPEFLVEVINKQNTYTPSDHHSTLLREIAKMANDKHSIGFDTDIYVHDIALQDIKISGTGDILFNWNPDKKELLLAEIEMDTSFSFKGNQINMVLSFDRKGALKKIRAFDAIRAFIDKSQNVLNELRLACENNIDPNNK